MIELRTAEIAELAHGESQADAIVTGVSIDSRAVRPGDLFVALTGAQVDGTMYADQAIAAGAAAALVRRGAEGPGRIAVDDPLEALGVLAREVRLRSTAAVVGITGSTGKTSTKDILATLVAPHAALVSSRQNENNELGVPLTLSRLEVSTKVAIVEMAMRGLGQIAYLAEIARPQIGILTGVGPVHLELLGTVENVAAAKAEMLAALPADGVAVVPQGEPLLDPHLPGLAARVVTFGAADGADVRLAEFRPDEAGGEAEIRIGSRTLHVPVSFTGPHNAVNLTAALAAYDALGLPLDAVGGERLEVEFSRWRGEEIPLPGGGLLIADCYNANPTSMRAALEHLSAVARGRRRVAVLG
ncbi:MAG TPA: UDP-N-acetylmuramoyl-tripeptide--D-alanyl-D-alanine ligase, partial [Gaiellales bacterium]|nr:UDP-N-acetylmuramoyl-tripeptide--D-alanyl-D-alanine ligase [Gaiellales bacterium]